MARDRIYAPNRLRELRTARGFSLEELGAAMPSDLSSSTVYKLENRRMALSADYILEAARALQVDPGEILRESAAPVRMVPVAGKIAAGNWREAVEMSDDMLALPAHLTGANLFALRPDGDSMDRIVPAGADGGYIVVDPDQVELIDRKFYAVMNEEGETTFKQFSANPLALRPCSTNDDHRPILIGTTPFKVIGRVVYVGQEL